MHPSSLHHIPVAPWFFVGLSLLLAAAVALIQIGLFRYSYAKMGISRRYIYGLLFLSLIGSYVNIPIGELPSKEAIKSKEISFFGVPYVVPVVEEPARTILAINVGGAVIPILVSIYLLVHNGLYVRGAIAVAIVSLVVHALAREVPGVGIAVPTFMPPIVAAIVAVILSRQSAAPLAYIAGSMGILVGADLMNLGSLTTLGGTVASIGGAGTFDGVFLCGILAVLLAW
jgi:uncharacterized membrane protein